MLSFQAQEQNENDTSHEKTGTSQHQAEKLFKPRKWISYSANSYKVSEKWESTQMIYTDFISFRELFDVIKQVALV